MDQVKQVAFTAARKAGAILRERLGKIKNIDYKNAFDIVTDVDKESERNIIDTIKEAFPDDGILAEETGAHTTNSSRRWIIDPLDGTTNFTHAYPFFCVSIGFEDKGELQCGVVYNPIADEMFWAAKGQGAYLNDHPIHVSNNASLATSLCATGFPPDSANVKFTNMNRFADITAATRGVRRDGSAALDLSFVACGRLDGYWEMKLSPWDLAAGVIIVREAGGTVTNQSGGTFDLTKGHVLATNGAIHKQLAAALAFDEKLVASGQLTD